ncbi:MAG: hypothetical protein IJW17_06320, partial [Lentisphaeria bacterium]|nr:hypothetical protein [Lentisphaeria bacterium]
MKRFCFFFLFLPLLLTASELEKYTPSAALWNIEKLRSKQGHAQTALIRNKNGVEISSDFSSGGNSVGGMLSLPEDVICREMSFLIKAPWPYIVLEVIDASGQHHFQFKKLSGDNTQFQQVTVKRFAGTKKEGFGHWGGKNSGELVGSVRKIWIRWVGNSAPKIKKSTVILKDILLYIVPRKLQITVSSPSTLIAPPGAESPVFFFNRSPRMNELEYTVADYSGNIISQGKTSIDFQNFSFKLPFPDQYGFFEYQLKGLDCRIGMLAQRPAETETDPFWGVDGAFSVFQVFRDPSTAEEYFRILNYCGIRRVRDRLRWSALEWEKGKFDFNALSTETLLKTAVANNCKVCTVFHDAPQWTGNESKRTAPDFYPYPRDLVGMADSFRKIGKRFAPYLDGLEVWNEPELGFGDGLPGNQQGALLRTVSKAFADEKLPI